LVDEDAAAPGMTVGEELPGTTVGDKAEPVSLGGSDEDVVEDEAAAALDRIVVGTAAVLEFEYGARLPGRIVEDKPEPVPLEAAPDAPVALDGKVDDGCASPVPVGE
jgi:hypothetical protein